jgi:hypothetical protein
MSSIHATMARSKPPGKLAIFNRPLGAVRGQATGLSHPGDVAHGAARHEWPDSEQPQLANVADPAASALVPCQLFRSG